MFGRHLGFTSLRGAMPRALSATCLGLLLLAGTSPALAVPLEIQFSGVNLSYASNTISDAGSPLGGTPADADPVDTMSFKVNNVLAGPILMNDIFVDISIPDVTGLSDVNFSTVVPTVGNPGYFNLYVGSPVPTEFLRLDTSTVTVTYINATSQVHFVFGGAVAAVNSQNLPYGLQIGDPVTVSFSSQVTSKTAAGGFVTSFLADGTGEINGELVPEPATCLLAVLGLAGAMAGRRRK